MIRFRRKFGSEDEMGRYVSALYDVLANTIGSDKLVLRAGKMNALNIGIATQATECAQQWFRS